MYKQSLYVGKGILDSTNSSKNYYVLNLIFTIKQLSAKQCFDNQLKTNLNINEMFI